MFQSRKSCLLLLVLLSCSLITLSHGSALVYSTFLGGSNIAEPASNGIAVDSAGNAYVVGCTISYLYPVTPGAYDTCYSLACDVVVTKLNASGSAVIYSTYLGSSSYVGSSGFESGTAIAIDSAGNAYITGYTSSSSFPTTVGAYQASTAGDYDVFITKLNPTGSALVYSTFLGGRGEDLPSAIAVDSAGNAFVSGYTYSNNFPTTVGAFSVISAGGQDGFVSKLNSTGTGLLYSTYLGGTGSDVVNGMDIDVNGNTYVTGYTYLGNLKYSPMSRQKLWYL